MEKRDNRNLSDIKQRIEHYWNGRADQYDGQFGHGIFSNDETRAWLGTLERNLHPPGKAAILDVGCGTGFLSLLLSELGYMVTGVDFSDEMMAEAARKAESKGLTITWLHGDAETPPVKADTFEAVISRHLLWTLPDPEKALTNWKNLLPPGGQIIVIDGVWTPKTPYAKAMAALSSALVRMKGRNEHGNWEQEYMRNPGDLPFMGGAEPHLVVELFEKVGLVNIHLDDMADILRCEKKIAPLEHKLRYALGKTRYLISGFKPPEEKQH